MYRFSEQRLEEKKNILQTKQNKTKQQHNKKNVENRIQNDADKMTDSHKGNYCLECDANNGDLNDAYKYASDTKQLRDSVIGYGKDKIRIFFY